MSHSRTETIESWIDLRNRLLLIEQTASFNDKMLEVGVGQGELNDLLMNHGYEVWACDKEHTDHNRFRWDITESFSPDLDLPPFDYVICCHVLEHTPKEDLHQTITNLKDVLEEGGKLFVELPSSRSLAYMLGRFGRYSWHWHKGHYKKFKPRGGHTFEVSKDYPLPWILHHLIDVFGEGNVELLEPEHPMNSVYFLCTREAK